MLANLLQPKLRYLQDKCSLLSIERNVKTDMLAAVKLKEQETDNPSIQSGRFSINEKFQETNMGWTV